MSVVPPRRIRAWVITPELHRRGGTERSVWEHLARWRDTFDTRVFATSRRLEPVEGVPMRRVPAVPTPHLVFWTTWVVMNRVRRWLASITGARPDVVVSPGVNAPDADVVAVHLLFSRLVEAAGSAAPATGVARSLHRRAYFFIVSVLERRTFGGPATISAVSARDAREVEARFDRPMGSVVVVPHGVDADAFSPERISEERNVARAQRGLTDRRVMLLVGNEPTVKGFDIAIDALKKLPVDVVLVLAGRFDRTQVRRWVETAGLADRVLVLAHHDEPTRLYALADVAIAPSRQDSFNLPALEALACGLPLVASDAIGLAEHLLGCADAVLVASPVDPGSLADAVAAMLERGEADGSGRALARTLDWDSSARGSAASVEREATTPRMLVLATDAGGTGGIQRATRTLVAAAADQLGGERVGVLSIWRGEHVVVGRTLRNGADRIGESGVGLLRSVRFSGDAASTARRWRRRLAVVVAHPHLAPAGWLARIVSGAPYAVWCHGIEVWGAINPITAFALRRADVVFAPSRFTADQVEERAALERGSVRVFPHCVPPEFAPSPEEAPAARVPGRVLTVARLHPDHAYKGVDTLIDVWPSVLRDVPEATLTVVGEGPDRERLERRASSLGVTDAVVFTGRLSDRDLAVAYATSWLFAMPARHRTGPAAEGEGFGLVFVEAGAAGLPVVAGAGAGADDAVEHDVSGLLVDPVDRDAVAGAVVAVLCDRELATRLGEGGRRLAADRFSVEAFTVAVRDLLGSMPVRGLVR